MTSPVILRRVVIVAALLATVFAPATAPTAKAGIGSALAGTVGLNGTNFVSRCNYSHHLPDDPIVAPDFPGFSHDHSFFANRTTNADSTYESMRAGTTSCGRAGDTAGYWVPTLLSGDTMAQVTYVNVYYWNDGKPAAGIKPFPPGLRIVTDPAARREQVVLRGAQQPHTGQRDRAGVCRPIATW